MSRDRKTLSITPINDITDAMGKHSSFVSLVRTPRVYVQSTRNKPKTHQFLDTLYPLQQ